MISTPFNVYEAYEKGLRTKYKTPLSPEEIMARKTDIDQNIVKLLEAQARLKTEMVQQYGTVRTAKEQTTNQIQVAAINYFAETGAATTEAQGRVLATEKKIRLDAAVEIIYGDAETEAAVQEYKNRLTGARTPIAEFASGERERELADVYVSNVGGGDGAFGKIEGDLMVALDID